MAGQEQRIRQNNAIAQQLDMEAMNQEASMLFQPKYTKSSEEHDGLINEYANWDTYHKGIVKPASIQAWDKYKE